MKSTSLLSHPLLYKRPSGQRRAQVGGGGAEGPWPPQISSFIISLSASILVCSRKSRSHRENCAFFSFFGSWPPKRKMLCTPLPPESSTRHWNNFPLSSTNLKNTMRFTAFVAVVAALLAATSAEPCRGDQNSEYECYQFLISELFNILSPGSVCHSKTSRR